MQQAQKRAILRALLVLTELTAGQYARRVPRGSSHRQAPARATFASQELTVARAPACALSVLSGNTAALGFPFAQTVQLVQLLPRNYRAVMSAPAALFLAQTSQVA